jgi:hypothetical protein
LDRGNVQANANLYRVGRGKSPKGIRNNLRKKEEKS